MPVGTACTITVTPSQKAHSDSGSLQPQQEPAGPAKGFFCGKLAIPDDACSLDGPPTPDNEEADRVYMPAAKRLRLDGASPQALAATVARALYLL